MPRSYRLLFFRPLLVVAAGALLLGCGAGEPNQGVGDRPQPHPSNHRDFSSADRLSAYLRSDARPLVAAHRGGPTEGSPENAIPTFAHALTEGPVLLEVDVRMSQDSVLVLMHDETLGRTTTGSGEVRARTLSELRELRLRSNSGRDTPYQIPTVAEALAWAEGRAVLQLDVKENVPRSRVASVLRRLDALDRALVITYTLQDARWYHRRLPALLLSVATETVEEARAHLNAIESSRLVAFAGVGPPSEDLVRVLSSRGVPVTVGTFGELDQQARRRGVSVYRELFRQGVDIVATDETALARQAAGTYRADAAAGKTE